MNEKLAIGPLTASIAKTSSSCLGSEFAQGICGEAFALQKLVHSDTSSAYLRMIS